MKVTILGSSGQIGAYLTEYLSNKGHEVTEFDVARHHGEDLTLKSLIIILIVLSRMLTLYTS